METETDPSFRDLHCCHIISGGFDVLSIFQTIEHLLPRAPQSSTGVKPHRSLCAPFFEMVGAKICRERVFSHVVFSISFISEICSVGVVAARICTQPCRRCVATGNGTPDFAS